MDRPASVVKVIVVRPLSRYGYSVVVLGSGGGTGAVIEDVVEKEHTVKRSESARSELLTGE